MIDMSIPKNSIPKAVQAVLWSYDISKIDAVEHKDIIIPAVLNYGTSQATDWLFDTYAKTEIVPYIQNPKPGFWNKKSLHYWSLIFKITPIIKPRFA